MSGLGQPVPTLTQELIVHAPDVPEEVAPGAAAAVLTVKGGSRKNNFTIAGVEYTFVDLQKLCSERGLHAKGSGELLSAIILFFSSGI